MDLVSDEGEGEEGVERPRSTLDRLLLPMDLPIKEGCESMLRSLTESIS